jgi:hypothetical protein
MCSDIPLFLQLVKLYPVRTQVRPEILQPISSFVLLGGVELVAGEGGVVV